MINDNNDIIYDNDIIFGFTGVGFASRQIANLARPTLIFSIDDQGLTSMKSITTFKTVEIKFRLDEEFDELTADDRQAKVESRDFESLLKTSGFYCILF